MLKIRSIQSEYMYECSVCTNVFVVTFVEYYFSLYRFFGCLGILLSHHFCLNHIKYVCQHLLSQTIHFCARVHSEYNFRFIFSGKCDRIAFFSFGTLLFIFVLFYFVFSCCYRACFSLLRVFVYVFFVIVRLIHIRSN